MDEPLALEMIGIDKAFPGAHALRAVDLRVRIGEIHGLVGENGAGKSTLVKILSGAYARDAGTIEVAGDRVDDATPQQMIERGVAVIYQEPALAPHLSVAENLFMGRLPTRRAIVDRRRLVADTRAVAERLGLDLDPLALVGSLSVARRQMVEIARALSRDARLIVLDEPSAVLADPELEGLFTVMRRLAERGVAFLYISHRLHEVFDITERVTVMKDGAVVATLPTTDLTHDRLVRLMVGREIDDIYGTRRGTRRTPGARSAPPVLAVRGLSRRGVFDGVDLEVHGGEIVGVAGLAGSGRTEILRAIHGADPIDGGQVEIDGRPVVIRSPRDAVAHRIGLLTEDRKGDGLALHQPVAANITIARLRDVLRGVIIDTARERAIVEGHIERLRIRTPSHRAVVSGLSGGNQQKVVFARWLHARCRILLIDEPTRGVDVGAKREIYALLRDLAANGVAIVMVSSELPEILGLSDRIVVMREGQVAATMDGTGATEESIMAAATPLAA
jgi:ribose transport system ATP-binding protein